MHTSMYTLPKALLFTSLLLLLLATSANIAAATGPNLLPAAAGDEKWDPQFAPEGLNGTAWALAVKGADVYVGGKFTVAGGVAANNIARWNATTNTWFAVGSGLDDEVDAIVFKGNDLYVGGAFTHAGGNPANGIAMWSGTAKTWSAVGGGMDGPVVALAVKGNDLYAGGFFTHIGATAFNHIAKWNTTAKAWSDVGGGTDGVSIRALVFKGNDLYAAGAFAHAGSGSFVVAAVDIAKWSTTTKTWTALGAGLNDVVRTLAVKGSDIYAGGFFTASGVAPLNHIAKWSATTKNWSALGAGTDKPVRTLAFKGSDLYAGGEFTKAGGVDRNALAKWSTSAKTWASLAGSPDNPVNSLVVKGSDLYAGGEFLNAGAVNANYMGEYDTAKNQWGGCGNGLDNAVYALAKKGNDIYAGGDFTRVRGVLAGHIAQFQSSTGDWFLLGKGVNGPVYALLVKGNDVYVGGNFATAFNPDGSAVVAKNIAVWSTTKKVWSALGGGTSGQVNALVLKGNDLYVGGSFGTAGTTPVTVKNVAKWNTLTKTWSALGSGAVGTNGDVYALALYTNRYVFAGGSFSAAGNQNPANYSAVFDTTSNSWGVLGNQSGNGVDGPVYAITFSGTYVWLGGAFNHTHTPGGDHSHKNIVATNMNEPHNDIDIGDVDGPVRAILPVGNRMYVAGEFTKTYPGAKTVDFLCWGSQVAGWQAMGSGLDNFARALVSKGQDIYVGGLFQNAGGKPSLSIARWMGP